MPVELSVCVPIYNGERFLPDTLRCLADNDIECEIVALDNASTDATAEILADCRDPRLRVERNPEVLPLAENWRRVIDLSDGELVKVVCADDLISPTCLREQADILRERPEITLVASRRHLVDEDGTVVEHARGLRGLLGRHPGSDVARQAAWLGHNPIGESAAVMFRRHDYDAVGGWDGTLVYPMDLDLWMKLLSRGDLWGERAALAAYRMSQASLTSAFSRAQYRENSEFLRSMADDPHWRLGRPTRAAARISAPLSLYSWSVRHSLLPLSSWLHRRRGSA